VEQTLNSIPSRAQNCNINVSYSNNQLDRDPENSQISYLEPSVTKPKYKKTFSTTYSEVEGKLRR
jgi:hypothetical protein